MRGVADGLTRDRRLPARAFLAAVAAALLVSGCRAAPPGSDRKDEVVVWKNLGRWSGRGNLQTESFVGLTGARAAGIESVTWRTRDTGKTETRPIRHVFLFLGAEPSTGSMIR